VKNQSDLARKQNHSHAGPINQYFTCQCHVSQSTNFDQNDRLPVV
jgi:hypothetical protein